MPLINCEIELGLKWARNCIIIEILRTSKSVNPTANPVVYQKNNAMLYVPVVTLSINPNSNFLENIKQVFKRTVSWKV